MSDKFVWRPEDGPLVRPNTNDPVKCPTCGSDKFTYRPGGERWWCGQCRVSFEVGKNPTPAPVTIEGTVDSGVGGLASTRPALPSTAGGGTCPATRTLSPADVPARDRLDALVETVREALKAFNRISSEEGGYTEYECSVVFAALSELAGIARERDRYREALRILESSEDHRLKAAEAELERLKDALRLIEDPTNHHHKPDYVRPEVIARAALADVGGTEGASA